MIGNPVGHPAPGLDVAAGLAEGPVAMGDDARAGAATSAARGASSAAASLAYLAGRLEVVEARVQRVVERRRSTDPDPSDRFRGLYISDAHVDQLLARPAADGPPPDAPAEDPGIVALHAAVEAAADAAEASGAVVRLRRVARSFGLDDRDTELLLVVLAPDLDARFERLYAYLNDDVSRRRPSIGLALELIGARPWTSADRSRLDPAAPLVRGGLLTIDDGERPYLTRALRVADRVTGYLLGDDHPDPLLADLLVDPVGAPLGEVAAVARSIAGGTRLCYVRERPGSAGLAMAAAAFRVAGLPFVTLDLGRLTSMDDAMPIAASAVREARLRGGGLIAGPIETLAETRRDALRVLAEAPCPVILHGGRGWDPGWSRSIPLAVDAPVADLAQRERIWREALFAVDATSVTDPALATLPFRLNPEQMVRAAHAAAQLALAQDRALDRPLLLSGARAQNAAGLERLARRIEPRAAWEDLVLPGELVSQLNELTGRARHRDRVLEDWGMAARSSRGRGLTALFAGDSGTGKTMSAEVVARDLGLDLYVIDLSTVVDKYIGETEKNLDRIFAEADRVNGVLLFDEADALFGKRSEVQDARDRYANIEIAYLLQRMEQFDGLAVLTTNLRANVDEAFLRRLDVIVDFPMPEEADRLRLWQKHLVAALPRAEDVDCAFLAQAFKLSGGNIRNVCLAAAFLAAAEDRPVTMSDLIRATQREYQKLGRLTHADEFGPYFDALVAVPER